MRIVGVKKDISDKTLTIPTHIIVPMNADFKFHRSRYEGNFINRNSVNA